MFKCETISTNLKGFATKFGCITSESVISSYQIFYSIWKRNQRLSGSVVQVFFVLFQGVFSTLQMTPDNPGEWAIVCRTNDHYSAGMQAKYKVKPCGKVPTTKPPGTVRRYYVAAVEEEWDYAPTGRDVLEGKPLQDSELVYSAMYCTVQCYPLRLSRNTVII